MTWYGFQRALIVPIVVLIWLGTGLTQLQSALVGRVVFPTVYLRIALLSLVIAGWVVYAVLNGRISLRVPVPLARLYVVWLLVTLAHWVLLFRLGYDAAYLVFTLNAYFFFPLIALFFVFPPSSSQPEDPPAPWLLPLLSVLAVPIFILGIAQFLLNDPLVPVDDFNEFLLVNKWDFGGRTRAFSVFASGWKFGEFIAFVGGLWLAASLVSVRRRPVRLLVALAFVAVAGYSTLTRNAYAQIGLTLIGAWLVIRTTISPRRIAWISVAAFVLLFGATVAAAFVVGDPDRSSVTSNASLIARLAHWVDFAQTVRASPWHDRILGLGLVQNDRFDVSAGLSLDNAPIALYAYVGVLPAILGVILFLGLLCFFIVEARRTRDPVWIALAGWCFSVPAVGSLNTQLTTPALLCVLVLCVSRCRNSVLVYEQAHVAMPLEPSARTS